MHDHRGRPEGPTGYDRRGYPERHARGERRHGYRWHEPRRRAGDNPASGYGGPYRPYGHEFFRYGAPVPGEGVYPEHHFGGGMMYGLEGAGWAPFGMVGFPLYAYEYAEGRHPRYRPEESPTYGRGGDRELRRWARHHGYRLGPPLGRRRR